MTPSQHLTFHAALTINEALKFPSAEHLRIAVDAGQIKLTELLWAYLQSGSDVPAVISILRAWSAANAPELLSHLEG